MKLTIDLGLKEALKPELAHLNQSLEKLAKQSDGFLGDLLSYILIGSGKRVRPALVHLAAQLGNAPLEAVRTVAQAVELIHIATLVHDDVIDKAALRRGLKTVVNLHGVDTAVLLGDHVYTYAFSDVAKLNNPQILGLMAQSTSIMCAGEIEQLQKRYKYDLSEEDYFSFIYKKTASLFGVSARAGAILAGQSEKIQKALENFGVNLGIAFQITDDVLDLTGEEAVVGKTLRTDLKNGKITLSLIYHRDQLKKPYDVKGFYETLQGSNGHISDLIARMKKDGSIQYADDTAKMYVKKAMSNLDELPQSKTRDLLTALAEMLLRRKS